MFNITPINGIKTNENPSRFLLQIYSAYFNNWIYNH